MLCNTLLVKCLMKGTILVVCKGKLVEQVLSIMIDFGKLSLKVPTVLIEGLIPDYSPNIALLAVQSASS